MVKVNSVRMSALVLVVNDVKQTVVVVKENEHSGG